MDDEKWTRWFLLLSTSPRKCCGEIRGGCISGGAGKLYPSGGVVQPAEVQTGEIAAGEAQQQSTQTRRGLVDECQERPEKHGPDVYPAGQHCERGLEQLETGEQRQVRLSSRSRAGE